MTAERYADVWDAIAKSPAEAKNMKLRTKLMVVLCERIKTEKWTQTEAALRLGVTQPRISDLMRGKISAFSLDALVEMLEAAGVSVDFTHSLAAA